MNAGTLRKTLSILEIEERTAKKSGNKYRVAQCIVVGEKKKVGELMIFNPEIKAGEGDFFADFDITVDFERRVTAELIALTPVTTAKPAVRPSVS